MKIVREVCFQNRGTKIEGILSCFFVGLQRENINFVGGKREERIRSYSLSDLDLKLKEGISELAIVKRESKWQFSK